MGERGSEWRFTCVKEVILFLLLSFLLLKSLLMLLEVDKADKCNCDKGLNSIAILGITEIDRIADALL